MELEYIENKEFGGERPLYAKNNLHIKSVTINLGESSLKEGKNIVAEYCTFLGKYPFWCCNNFEIKNCVFKETGRAAIWYSTGMTMNNVEVEAPKMFRHLTNSSISNVNFYNAGETFWHCKGLDISNCMLKNADYIFMSCEDIKISNVNLFGNYSFQWSKNVEIKNCNLQSKDAFWETDYVTVYDSVINGEFLAWHSRNLKLVRCHIGGSQPLCYAENLILEDCTFAPDADLAFEYSNVQATINGHIKSIKNPRSGYIVADSIGEIIIDENMKSPGDCKITIRDNK